MTRLCGANFSAAAPIVYTVFPMDSKRSWIFRPPNRRCWDRSTGRNPWTFHRKISDGSVFHTAIADTEPDGWGRRVIVRDHAKRRQAARRTGGDAAPAQLNAVDFLLAVDDSSRVGGLRFKDEDGVFPRASEPGRRTVPPLVELGHLLAATRAVETETEAADGRRPRAFGKHS